jgi:hypothetical protein
MRKIDERSASLPESNLIDLHFPATDNDILREIKTTNEYMKIMIDRMDEILANLRGKTQLLPFKIFIQLNFTI